MSGIYIHIPFCKKACHYCNFHFSTSLNNKSSLLDALKSELQLQVDFLPSKTIDTVYFGGGTPSILTIHELEHLIATINKSYNIDSNAEWTLEANPDDLDLNKITDIKSIGINRLSIGIQSFDNEDLIWMNRSHNAEQALNCIKHAFKVGLDNFSVDLIFGSPTTSDKIWEENLKLVKKMGIKHISCYGLTVEKKTALDHFIQSGKEKPLDETKSTAHFLFAMEYLRGCGYDHYEISNYCLPGFESKHNSSYWQQKPYLGIGPAAHSFNGVDRQWNVSDNVKYIKALENKEVPSTIENLKIKDRYNEYILTGLRTKWGCELTEIEKFGKEISAHFEKESKPLIEEKILVNDESKIVLNPAARIMADKIMSDLFIV